MYAGVPSTWPSKVSVTSAPSRNASPKSVSNGRSSWPRPAPPPSAATPSSMLLAGLRAPRSTPPPALQAHHQLRRLPERQPPHLEQVLEGDAVDEVADQDRQAIQGQHLVDGYHARMTQLRRRPRLTLEALHLLGVGAQAAVQDLQRHDA